MAWASLHATYYDPRKDSLLLHAVAPGIAEVRTAGWDVGRIYVRRHWHLGPHVRINIEVPPDVFTARVEPLLRTRFIAFFESHPSRARLEPESYVRLSARLGEAELVPGPYAPLRPDNSVQTVPYDGREHLVGGAIAAELLADYLAGVHDLLFELLAETRGHEAGRLTRLLACMISLACVHPRGLAYGQLSFRSHAEAFLGSNPPLLRDRFVLARTAYLPHATSLVRDIIAGVEAGVYGGPDAFLARWSAFHAAAYVRFREIAAAGGLPDRHPTEHGYAQATGFPNFATEQAHLGSEFHRAAAAAGIGDLRPAWFRAFRFLLNAFYVNLPTLGVDAITKFLLCDLVAEASEQVLDTTWRQLLNL